MKIIKTNCLLRCKRAAAVIAKLKPLQRFRITFYDNSSFSAIRASVDGFSFQNWNAKTMSWDSLPLNPRLVKEVKFY